MSNTDPAATPAPDDAAAIEAIAADAAATAAAAEEPAVTEPAAEEEAAERVPVITEREQEVTLVRSVRIGRVLIGGAIFGAALLTLASLFFPVGPESEFSMGQVIGFMALIGGALGLCLGGILVVAMGAAAKRKQGVAVAIQTDVQ